MFVPAPGLAYCGMQDRLGRLKAAAERRPSRGGTTWVALFAKATHRLSPSVLRLSDRITGRRVGSTQQLVLTVSCWGSTLGLFASRAGPRISRAAVASAASTTVNTRDHHSEYLAKAVAALTPEGRKRVDELLDQLAVAGRSREWVVRFALAREAEVEAGRTDTSPADEPGERLNEEDLDSLTAGFMTIRDQEPLDDVNDWANAVLALLADERE